MGIITRTIDDPAGGVQAAATQTYTMRRLTSLVHQTADDSVIWSAPKSTVSMNQNVNLDFYPMLYITLGMQGRIESFSIPSTKTITFTWVNTDDGENAYVETLSIPPGSYSVFEFFSWVWHGDPMNLSYYIATDRPAHYTLLMSNNDNAFFGWQFRTYTFAMTRTRRRARINVMNVGESLGHFRMTVEIREVDHGVDITDFVDVKTFTIAANTAVDQDFFFYPILSGNHRITATLEIDLGAGYFSDDSMQKFWFMDGSDIHEV